MSFDSGVGDMNDGELEKFLNVEKVKTQLHEQVNILYHYLHVLLNFVILVL